MKENYIHLMITPWLKFKFLSLIVNILMELPQVFLIYQFHIRSEEQEHILQKAISNIKEPFKQVKNNRRSWKMKIFKMNFQNNKEWEPKIQQAKNMYKVQFQLQLQTMRITLFLIRKTGTKINKLVLFF